MGALMSDAGSRPPALCVARPCVLRCFNSAHVFALEGVMIRPDWTLRTEATEVPDRYPIRTTGTFELTRTGTGSPSFV